MAIVRLSSFSRRAGGPAADLVRRNRLSGRICSIRGVRLWPVRWLVTQTDSPSDVILLIDMQRYASFDEISKWSGKNTHVRVSPNGQARIHTAPISEI
jgi:hypothetical protein